MWWAWELSESRKCVMEVVVVVVVVRYGGLCLESFSASVGDDPPLHPFPTGVAAGVGLAAQRTDTIGVLDPDGTTATLPPPNSSASVTRLDERMATGNLRPSCMLLVRKFALHRIVHERWG